LTDSQTGEKQSIENPTKSQLPDLLDIGKTFQYNEGSETMVLIFNEENDSESEVEVLVKDPDGKKIVDATELIAYINANNKVTSAKVEDGETKEEHKARYEKESEDYSKYQEGMGELRKKIEKDDKYKEMLENKIRKIHDKYRKTKASEDEEQGNYKSDEDIEKEFEDFKVVELNWDPRGLGKERKEGQDWKSGKIVIDFPEAGESVGGGTNEVVDYFMMYDDGKFSFDHWYPEGTSNKIKEFIKQNVDKDIGTEYLKK
jgi:hypothetical protein